MRSNFRALASSSRILGCNLRLSRGPCVACRVSRIRILVTIGLLHAAARRYRYPRPRGLRERRYPWRTGTDVGTILPCTHQFLCVCFVFVFVFAEIFARVRSSGSVGGRLVFLCMGGCRSSVSQSAGRAVGPHWGGHGQGLLGVACLRCVVLGRDEAQRFRLAVTCD